MIDGVARYLRLHLSHVAGSAIHTRPCHVRRRRRRPDEVCISAVSRLYLGCISAVSRLYPGCISAPHPQAAQTTGAVGAAENSRCATRSLYLGYISAHAPKFVRHEIVGA